MFPGNIKKFRKFQGYLILMEKISMNNRYFHTDIALKKNTAPKR